MKLALISSDGREPLKLYDSGRTIPPPPQAALLQGMSRLPGLEVHHISCLQQPVREPEQLVDNVRYHSLHVPKTGWMRTLYQGCIRAVRKKLKEIQPDIVHGQGTERECAMAAALSGFPNVVTIHGIMQEQVRLLGSRPGSFLWLAAKLETFALRRTAGVLCNSAYTENCIRPRAAKTWRVPNPLQSAFFELQAAISKPVRPVLLNVGYITQRKRQVELIQSAQSLKNCGLDFELHFIGRADASDAYVARFMQLVGENSGWIKYLGSKKTDELIASFDHASALIHVPTEESFGLVAAEALSRNLKFFGSATGGVVDIASGVEGVELFPQSDWPAMEDAIARWIAADCPRPVAAAAVMRERYHPQIVAQRHLEIYREVLAANNKS
jgi:glycosyltransferase involved in cell wall biosynthesis